MKLRYNYTWFVLTIVGYALSLLLLVQILLAGHIWWWSIMSAIPPWGWLIVPIYCFVVFSFRRRNFALLACGIVTLVLAGAQSDLNIGALWHHNAEKPANTITVMSWNSLAWYQKDNKAWLEYVAAHQEPDVLMLQEIIKPRTWDTPYPAELTAHFPGYKLIPYGEWLTITKLPVVGVYAEQGQFWLRVDVDMQGKRVSLYNVHIPVHMSPMEILHNPLGFFADMHERVTLRTQQLALLEKELRANTYPKIIAGDFNSTRSMGVLGYFYDAYTDVSTLDSGFFPSTWGNWGLYMWRIDWAFISKEILPVSYTTLPRTDLSDHVPLEFQVSLP